jgi:hypothetical protein
VIWNLLARFFIRNEAFECLEVVDGNEASLGAMESTLRRFCSLKELILVNNNYDWTYIDGVVKALVSHPGLRKLILHDIQNGRRGCAALAAILQNPRSNLTALHLQGYAFNDEEASIFAAGLAKNNTLKISEIFS